MDTKEIIKVIDNLQEQIDVLKALAGINTITHEDVAEDIKNIMNSDWILKAELLDENKIEITYQNNTSEIFEF